MLNCLQFLLLLPILILSVSSTCEAQSGPSAMLFGESALPRHLGDILPLRVKLLTGSPIDSSGDAKFVEAAPGLSPRFAIDTEAHLPLLHSHLTPVRTSNNGDENAALVRLALRIGRSPEAVETPLLTVSAGGKQLVRLVIHLQYCFGRVTKLSYTTDYYYYSEQKSGTADEEVEEDGEARRGRFGASRPSEIVVSYVWTSCPGLDENAMFTSIMILTVIFSGGYLLFIMLDSRIQQRRRSFNSNNKTKVAAGGAGAGAGAGSRSAQQRTPSNAGPSGASIVTQMPSRDLHTVNTAKRESRLSHAPLHVSIDEGAESVGNSGDSVAITTSSSDDSSHHEHAREGREAVKKIDYCNSEETARR